MKSVHFCGIEIVSWDLDEAMGILWELFEATSDVGELALVRLLGGLHKQAGLVISVPDEFTRWY